MRISDLKFKISDMKLRLVDMKEYFVRFTVFVFILAVAVTSAAAQTKRTKPKPLATPPVVTGAEIISQAGDYVEPEPTPAEKPQTKPATTNTARIRELNDRLKKLETAQSSNYDERQKRLKLNLDILKSAEDRADSMRDRLFGMIEKENKIKAQLDQIEYDIRPENIERLLQLGGSMKPEEVRENRRKSLAAEKTNLQSLLTQIQATRANLETNLQKAEQMVERLRAKTEKDIDESLQRDEEPEKINDQQPEN
jgi:chromosome segregation ATPase